MKIPFAIEIDRETGEITCVSTKDLKEDEASRMASLLMLPEERRDPQWRSRRLAY